MPGDSPIEMLKTLVEPGFVADNVRCLKDLWMIAWSSLIGNSLTFR